MSDPPVVVKRSWGRLRQRNDLTSAVFALVVLVTIGAALLFSRSGFASDFTNSIWLGSVQGATVGHGVIPSLFINTTAQAPLPPGYSYPYPTTGLFNPVFAFYGGPVFAIFGYLVDICAGQVLTAFCLLTMLAMAGAYYGIFRIARIARCGRPSAHAAAITFVASAYYIADLYGRGDWIEFMAVSSIPLLVASAVDLLKSTRFRARDAVLFVWASLLFTGSHNTTLLWGSIFLALVSALLVICRVIRLPRIRRVGAVALLGACGAGLNAWAIVPALLYSKSTYYAHNESVIGTPFTNTFKNLFNPLRSVPVESTSPGLFMQVPLWMLAWAFVAGVYFCVLRPATREARRAWFVMAALTVFYFVLMMNRQIWLHLPHVLSYIQNLFLLSTYVSFCVVALVIITRSSATAHRDPKKKRSRALLISDGALLACSAMTLALGVWQVVVPDDRQAVMSYVDRHDALVGSSILPHSWYPQLDYIDEDVPIVSVDPTRIVSLPTSGLDAHGDGYDLQVALPPGNGPILTNIIANPDFVSVSGDIEPIGRDSNGYLVVQRTTAGDGLAVIHVGTARSTGVVIGRALTASAATGIGLIAVSSTLLTLSRRRKRKRSMTPQASVVAEVPTRDEALIG